MNLVVHQRHIHCDFEFESSVIQLLSEELAKVSHPAVGHFEIGALLEHFHPVAADYLHIEPTAALLLAVAYCTVDSEPPFLSIPSNHSH